MSFGKLYGFSGNPRTIPALIVAKANNLDVELVETTPPVSDAAYLELNPLGKIPTFIGSNGFLLTESIAIAIYLTSQNEKTTLLGKTKQDYASILRWISFANQELLPAFGSWYRPLLGRDPYNKKLVDEAQKLSLKTSQIVERHLTENTYLVGERITLADIFTASVFARAFSFVLDKEFRSNHVAITRWFTTVTSQPLFKAVLENPVMVEEVIKYTPPKKEAPKKEAPKKEAPKKEEKPKPKKEEAVDDDDDGTPKPEPKPKHPLEALGKPTLILDEWKREYSNNETREAAMPWFWTHFKPDEYSLWLVDYKYNNELKLTFMANNLIGGFFARLEASRKFLFGAASVYGENYDCVIRGAFMARGQEHLPAFDVAPDWESYEFKKLDHTSESDRKVIEDLWAWDVPVTRDGKEFAWKDGHVFK